MKSEAQYKLKHYEDDWEGFKHTIESLAKGRCIITNKNWMKIREIHLNRYLSSIQNPFFFLFQLKFFCPKHYTQVKCIPKYYHLYKSRRFRSEEFYGTQQ